MNNNNKFTWLDEHRYNREDAQRRFEQQRASKIRRALLIRETARFIVLLSVFATMFWYCLTA